MKKILNLSIVLLLFITCTPEDEILPDEDLNCSESFKLKGDRLLGMDILNATENGSFEDDFNKGKEFGIQSTGLHLLWDQIETSTENYTDPWDALAAFDAFCNANDIKLNLTIRPIDLTGKTVPADLENIRFNTEKMKSRFKKLMDFIFTKMDYNLLTSLQIGNEIDGYDISNEHPDFWNDYGNFLLEMKTYAETKYPGLKIGFTVMLLDVLDGEYSNSGVFEGLAEKVDIIGVTYYPLNNDFTVMPPDVVDEHFNRITAKFSGKTLFFLEVGYQTSAKCNGSERKQAQFICNIFSAWDKHKAQIKLIEFARMNDVSPTEAEELAGPYGLSDENFIEYLRTLGFRTYDGAGVDKEAFLILKEQANLRGWN